MWLSPRGRFRDCRTKCQEGGIRIVVRFVRSGQSTEKGWIGWFCSYRLSEARKRVIRPAVLKQSNAKYSLRSRIGAIEEYRLCRVGQCASSFI
jgi:hypothetical protein